MKNFHHYVNRDDNLTMIAGLHQLMALHSHFSRGTQRTYSPRVQLLIHHICENYPSMITEASLAAQVNLSVQHMHRLFLSETGMSPIQYLNAYRIHCAKKMLEEDDLPIYAIAASSGFATPNYFCTVFRKFSGGLSPLEYRRAHHNTLVQKKRLSK